MTVSRNKTKPALKAVPTEVTNKASSSSLRAFTRISPADAYEFLKPLHHLMNAVHGLNHPTAVDFIGRIKATGKRIEDLTVGELVVIGEQMEADWRDQAS